MNRPHPHPPRPQPPPAAGVDAYGADMAPMSDRPLRIVQWTTGNVSRQTVRAVLAHPGLELVGAFAHSAEKVRRDLPVITSAGRVASARRAGGSR